MGYSFSTMMNEKDRGIGGLLDRSLATCPEGVSNRVEATNQILYATVYAQDQCCKDGAWVTKFEKEIPDFSVKFGPWRYPKKQYYFGAPWANAAISAVISVPEVVGMLKEHGAHLVQTWKD